MISKILIVLIPATAMVFFSTVLQAASSYCYSPTVVINFEYLGAVVTTSDGDEREACFEIEARCSKGEVGAEIDLFVIDFGQYYPGGAKIPLFRWYALTGTDPYYVICGDQQEDKLQVLAEASEWNTSCEFHNGSEFMGRIAEVDLACCETPNGYACDADNDGVVFIEDECPGTMPGDVVNDFGCSIAQLCPCEHPIDGSEWKTHGAYVQCVAHASEDFVDAGLISEAEKDAVVGAAGQSDCGDMN